MVDIVKLCSDLKIFMSSQLSTTNHTKKTHFFQRRGLFFVGGHDSYSQMTAYKNINRGEVRCPPAKIYFRRRTT